MMQGKKLEVQPNDPQHIAGRHASLRHASLPRPRQRRERKVETNFLLCQIGNNLPAVKKQPKGHAAQYARPPKRSCLTKCARTLEPVTGQTLGARYVPGADDDHAEGGGGIAAAAQQLAASKDSSREGTVEAPSVKSLLRET